MITRGSSGPQVRFQELAVPYWFSSLAQDRDEYLEIGSYVTVRGLRGKYEIMDIFPRSGSVRVREVGRKDEQTFPWSYVKPWKRELIRSTTVIQAVGDWLFRGSRVFTLSEPDRMLKQRKINWDTQTCDVEDEDGRVIYGVSWDDLEFWDPVDYHFPGDELGLQLHGP